MTTARPQEDVPNRKESALQDLIGGNRLTFVLAMLAVGLALRCYRITEPPMDFHPTRQYIGAAVARSYYFNMDSSIPEWRREIAQIGKDRQELLEPQIMPGMAAVSYRVTGGERLWIPRFYSILFWLATGGVLLVIARDIGLGEKERMWVLAIHLFAPFAVLNSRVFQPDPLMVLLMFLALWSALRYDRAPSPKAILVTTALAAATLFVKPVCVFMLFAGFAGLKIHRVGIAKTIRNPHLYVFTALMLAPAVSYYIIQLKSGGYIGTQTEGSFVPQLLFTFKYWFGWLKMIGRNIGLQGLVAAAIGFAMFANLRGRWFLGGVWFGYFCYGLFFSYQIHTHDYYSMAIIPMAALTAAPFMVRLMEFLRLQWKDHTLRLAGAAVTMGLAGLVVLAGLMKMKSDGKLTPEVKGGIKTAGSLFGADMKLLTFLGYGIDERAEVARYKEIGKRLNHTDKALYLTHDYGKSLTYHAEIAGEIWPGQTDFAKRRLAGKEPIDLVERLNDRIQKSGMRFFAATELDEFRKQPELVEELDRRHELLDSNDHHRLYALKPSAER